MLAPGREEDGWRMTPGAVKACVEAAASHGGRRVALLVITSPDNPTGRSMELGEQLKLARAAFAVGVPYVLFDWIYHRIRVGGPYDLNLLLGGLEPAERERCIILDGITRSWAGATFGTPTWSPQRLVKFADRASHAVIPSFHSQAVAIAAYRMGFDRAAASIIRADLASRRRSMADFVASTGSGDFSVTATYVPGHGAVARSVRDGRHCELGRRSAKLRSGGRAGRLLQRLRKAVDPIRTPCREVTRCSDGAAEEALGRSDHRRGRPVTIDWRCSASARGRQCQTTGALQSAAR
jgi:hypothetical protein